MGKGKHKKEEENQELVVTKCENKRGEELLKEYVEVVYDWVVGKLMMESGMTKAHAIRVVLLKGSIFETRKKLSLNVLKNCFKFTDYDSDFDIQPTLKDFRELAVHSINSLIDLVQNQPSKPSRKVAVAFIYCCPDQLGYMLKLHKGTRVPYTITPNSTKSFSPGVELDVYDQPIFEQRLVNLSKDIGMTENVFSIGLIQQIQDQEIQALERKEWVKEMLYVGREAVRDISECEILIEELKSYITCEMYFLTSFWEYKKNFGWEIISFFRNKREKILDIKKDFDSLKELTKQKKENLKQILATQEIKTKTEEVKLKLKQTRDEATKSLGQLLKHEKPLQLEATKLDDLVTAKESELEAESQLMKDEFDGCPNLKSELNNLISCSPSASSSAFSVGTPKYLNTRFNFGHSF